MKQQLIFGAVAGAFGLLLSLGPASAQTRSSGGTTFRLGQQRQIVRPRGDGRPGGGGRPGWDGRPGGGRHGWGHGPRYGYTDGFFYGGVNPFSFGYSPFSTYFPTIGSYGYYPGGYGFSYGGFGNDYGYGYGGQAPLVQQDFYYVRGGDGYGAGSGYAPPQPQQERARPRRDNPPPADDEAAPLERKDDFYLRGGGSGAPGQGERLTDALDDIRKAWLNGDFDRLKARIATDRKVRIFPGGEYRYSQAGSEFASMLHDAMARIDTLAFEFERPKSEGAGRAFVTGKHTFTIDSGKRQETYVSYGLERIGGRWRIVEAGSATSPIARHEEAAPAGQETRSKPSVKPQDGDH